ncbi:Maltose O-acetyltransferase [Lactiplantibacillus plantarum subsp. plantarum]|uniref:Maltose O-acetyltransferase n=1 Tax=Lactiplantibacillus plantarum subsp. plantarum TaxID=337330 RepID=A0A2S3UA90_LACPN|nr:Maltose O-acetyltransferase [Lactiplantibacillus plantarum subsp. plantarum]
MKSQKERMLAGELYVANDAELSRENHRAKRLVREFKPNHGRTAGRTATIIDGHVPQNRGWRLH